MDVSIHEAQYFVNLLYGSYAAGIFGNVLMFIMCQTDMAVVKSAR